MGNIPFNVLSSENRSHQDTLDQVAAMINNSGMNRGQRRRLEKALAKTEKLTEKAQRKLDYNAYKTYQAAVDKNFLHFFAILSLVMGEDYRWKEDESSDQITSLLERVGKKLEKYANKGYTTEDLVKIVEDKYGIVLLPEEH